MQVFGGHGYIRETGIEQYVRDARIAQIYEGANGIQALDLVGRKLGQHAGRLLRRFFHPVAACLEEAAHDPEPRRPGRAVGQNLWQAAAGHRFDRPARAGRPRGCRRRGDRLPPALRLRGVGLHVAAHGEAGAGPWPANDGDAGFYRAKVETARFYMQRTLPMANAHYLALSAGKESLMALAPEAF